MRPSPPRQVTVIIAVMLVVVGLALVSSRPRRLISSVPLIGSLVPFI